MGLKFFNGFNAINAERDLSQSAVERYNRLRPLFYKHRYMDAPVYTEHLFAAGILNIDETCLVQRSKTNTGKLHELARCLSRKPLKLIQELKHIASEMADTEFERDLSAQGF